MWRRRQQLASRIAKATWIERVIYVEQPLPLTSFVKYGLGRADPDGTVRWRRVLGNRSWVMPGSDKLSVLTTLALLPPLGHTSLLRATERAQNRWLLRKLRQQINLKRRPVVWASHPFLSVDLLRALEPTLLWYDCTEDFGAWPGYSDAVREQIQAADRWLTQHADVISAVSSALVETKQHAHPNVHWLPNAVDTDLFLRPDTLRTSVRHPAVEPPELRGVDRPVLAFVGGLSEWAHDYELLVQVAALRPRWTILLVGGLGVHAETEQMLRRHSNILSVGQKPYQDLPAYLFHSDICFQFYRPMRGNDTRNSQKLFLYFAAGKPVVSTPSADVQVYDQWVRVVDTPEAFVAGVELALATDSPEAARERQEIARGNSWAARANEVCSIMEDALVQQGERAQR
jgi:glycosyltransferase involved in cell wall biosynthesis